MKYTLLIILTVLGYQGFSQEKIETEKKEIAQIEIISLLEYGSTNLDNEFINKLLFGGKIDAELKDKVLGNTKNINRFGVELNFEIKVTILDTIFPKYPDHTYYIGFGSYRNVSAKYSRDFYKTMFYGNKSFAGETAELGNTNFTDSRFEKITFGILHKNRNSSLGISLIIGDKHNSFDFDKADLYTKPDGRQLTLDYDGKIKRSDSLKSSFFSFSGAGLGIDFRHTFFKKYTLNITNFGFAVWKRNARYSDVQKNYDYTGLEIDNLVNIGDNEIENKAKELLPESKNEGFVTLLPASIRVDKAIEKDKKLQLIYGVRYKLVSNYFPGMYFGGHYNATKNFGFNAAINYGGYSGLRASAGSYFKYKKLYAGLETSNIIGIFDKNSKSNGLGIYLFTHF